ncbi:MAG: hypothetical protein CL610_05965 [Anaerolineaceae bacterium]|nr:hypothetical protein [Anaerolineaceae bacterium]
MKHITCPDCGNNFITQHRLPDGELVEQCKQCLHTWPGEAKYFQGEMMVCALCDRQQQSDPNVNSHWRVLELDNHVYYVCSKHFPPDWAKASDFKHAYKYVIRKLTEKGKS